MTHYLMIVLIVAVIYFIDGRGLLKKQLSKELYAFGAIAAVIIIYGFMYFNYSYNASIAGFLDLILIHK